MTHTVFVKLMRQTFATAAVEIVSFMALNILIVEYFCIDYNKIQIYVGCCTCNNLATSRETHLQGFANNTGADQPAHPRSLISAFVFRFLESIICKLATGTISFF